MEEVPRNDPFPSEAALQSFGAETGFGGGPGGGQLTEG